MTSVGDGGATFGRGEQATQNSTRDGANSDQLLESHQPLQEIIKRQQEDYLSRLYLDTTNVQLEVQTHIGNIAYLMCRLRSLQTQQEHLRVSWVRNMSILTSGEFRYTSDERFRPTHVPGTQDWVLEVHNVRANDEDFYECQVNSEPKPARILFYLHVMSASLEILEAPQVLVGEGEQIRLTCRVEFSSQAQLQVAANNQSEQLERRMQLQRQLQQAGDQADGAAAADIELTTLATTTTTTTVTKAASALSSQYYIYWYKDSVSLVYNNRRGGIRVERRDSRRQQQRAASVLESVLTVEGASSADSGTYLCRIVPELNELPSEAQAQVLVGGQVGSSSAAAAPTTTMTAPLLLGLLPVGQAGALLMAEASLSVLLLALLPLPLLPLRLQVIAIT